MDVLDEEPEVARRARHAAAAARSRATSRFEDVRFGYGAGPRCCTGSTSTFPPGRPSRSSATPARASRRSRSCSPASTTRATGGITIDGHDLRDVTQASLRHQLGIVPQEGFLFAGTVTREHRLRPARRADARTWSAPPQTVGAHDFIVAARGRLRHTAAGARQPPVARPAPARRLRPRAARRPADPDPRRGDVFGRHRHRAQDRARAAHAARGPHGVHHRAPALDDPRRRPDRRARARPGRRAGLSRRADAPSAACTRRCTATGLPTRPDACLVSAPPPPEAGLHFAGRNGTLRGRLMVGRSALDRVV